MYPVGWKKNLAIKKNYESGKKRFILRVLPPKWDNLIFDPPDRFTLGWDVDVQVQAIFRLIPKVW